MTNFMSGRDRKNLVLEESSKLINQMGDSLVLELYSRIREIEALTRTISATVEQLPRHADVFHQVVAALFNFQGDVDIAGGGVWPEPYCFYPGHEKHAFFWARNITGDLVYLDDYNQSEQGYHQENWYVVGRHIQPGQCLWSASYTDPYSRQPMITCTTPIFEHGMFWGVVTVDLKLENVQKTLTAWQRKTGGYMCVLDRSNRFITFPDLHWVKRDVDNGDGTRIAEFISAHDLAAQQPCFQPFALALDAMNQAILRQAAELPKYQASVINALHNESPHISRDEAELIAAVMADPLGKGQYTTQLYRQFEVEEDCWCRDASTVFLFHVPLTYWKVFIVKPLSEVTMATYSLIQAEKMASLGQMVAGIAHEINNPINFIAGNLVHAEQHFADLLALLSSDRPPSLQSQPEHYPDIDLDFIRKDLPELLNSMKIGTQRVCQLVQSLRSFSRVDEAALKTIDIHTGIESTLLILNHRLKPSPGRPEIQITQKFADLPLIECYAGQLNQVFMNVLVNAIEALEDGIAEGALKLPRGDRAGSSIENSPSLHIHIQTSLLPLDRVLIQIRDNGPGIPHAIQSRLFDPFFTTKTIGQGTGLGLSICYRIIVETHHGEIRCLSTPGQGSEFQIEIPISQTGIQVS